MLARWASLIAIGSLAKIEASTTIDGGYTRANSRLVVAGRRRASAVANAARTSPGRRATCMTHRVALLTFHTLTTAPRAICIYMENTEYPNIYARARFEALAENAFVTIYGATVARVRVRGK